MIKALLLRTTAIRTGVVWLYRKDFGDLRHAPMNLAPWETLNADGTVRMHFRSAWFS